MTKENIQDVAAASHEASAIHAGESVPEVINKMVNDLVLMKEDSKLGPFTLKGAMEDAGIDFSTFPLLDSETGNLREKYPAYNAKGREIKGNYFKDYFKGTDWGKTLTAQLADAEAANDPKTSHQSKIYAHYVGNTLYLDDEVAMLGARITAGGNLYRSAVGIVQMEAAFISKLDAKKVALSYHIYEDSNGKEQMKRSNTPFVVSEPNKPGNYTRLNVTQFLKLNLDQALDNGGTYQAVIATLRKGAEGTKEGRFKIKLVEETFALLGSFVEFTDYESDRGRKHVEGMRKILRKDSSDEQVLAVGDAVQSLDTFFAEFEDRYQRLTKARAAATRDLNKPKAQVAA